MNAQTSCRELVRMMRLLPANTTDSDLDVQVFHELRVVLDEHAPGLDVVAHQRLKDLIGQHGFLDGHLEQRARFRIHRRVEELVGVHLAQALVPLDGVALRFTVAVREALDDVFALLLVVGIIRFLALRDTEERWLRDVDVARLDELRHLPEEEREQERADMGAVDVGVRHDDDLVIARLLELELVLDAAADRGDDRANLLVRQHLVDARLLDVDDLAAERQDRLEFATTALLRGTTGGIALDEIELAQRRITELAVGKLARQVADIERRLAAREVARLSRRFTRPRRGHRLLDDGIRRARMLIEVRGEPLVDERLDRRLDLRVAELRL